MMVPTGLGHLGSVAATRVHALFHDCRNLARYGLHAPLVYQCIWINPFSIRRHIAGFDDRFSGHVVDGDWDLMAVSISDHPKLHFCHLRWAAGYRWEDTGIIEHYLDSIHLFGSLDGCTTEADVWTRLEKLDRIFATVTREGRLRVRSEIVGRRSFREMGGMRVHVARDGEPIFGGAGYHRLGMALAVGLSAIPAQLGIVHPGAINSRGKRNPMSRDVQWGDFCRAQEY